MSKTNIHHCHHCDKPTSKTPSVDSRTRKLSDKVFCDRKCYLSFKAKNKKLGIREFTCEGCGKPFTKNSEGDRIRKFCTHECRNIKGYTACITECKVCKTVFSAIKWRYNDGKSAGYVKDKRRVVCSPECVAENFRTDEERKRKISESERGEKHHNWQGGGKRRGYRGVDWPRIAEKVRKRAGYKCEHCGISQDDCGRKLDVNHIEPFHQHRNKTQANKLSNLEALCKSCHMKTEWKWRKENPLQYAIKM